jgi:hypothetical protein
MKKAKLKLINHAKASIQFDRDTIEALNKYERTGKHISSAKWTPGSPGLRPAKSCRYRNLNCRMGWTPG